ncbi:MAG: hypothetical protein AB7F75_00970 [Planctomycetota bacterium]
MPTRTLTVLFGLSTFLVVGGALFFVAQSTFFNFDFYEYATNTLTMSRFDGDPFGYRLGARTILPSLVLTPLSWLFYAPGEALAFMRATGLFCFASLPLLLLVIHRALRHWGDSPLVSAALIFFVASNLMMLTTAMTSVIDGWASLFLVAGSLFYLRNRTTREGLALWGAAGFWILSGQWRINHMSFGVVLAATAWFWDGSRSRPIKVAAAGGAALTAFFLAPFILAYGTEGLAKAADSIRENRNILQLVAVDGFIYPRLALFGLGWPLIVLALIGAWKFHVARGWRAENFYILAYNAHFAFTHGVVMPQQYLRFLLPFIFPLALYWREALVWLESRGRLGMLAMVLVALSAVGPLASLARYASDPFFSSGRDLEVSHHLAKGHRMIWCGRIFPFHPRDVSWCPSPSFSLYHYANHTLKVHSGRDTLYIRRPPADDGLVPEMIPHGWAPFIEDDDRLFFNPNTKIFYHTTDIGLAASAEVWSLSKRPIDPDQLDVEALSVEERMGWLVRSSTRGGFEVRSPLGHPDSWIHLESAMGWPPAKIPSAEPSLVWIRERRAFSPGE